MKKSKLGFTQTSVRNLTSTELDAVGGGVITNNWKCSDIICPPTKYEECVTQNGSCAASCNATCAQSCAGSCAASCQATCAKTCAADCNVTRLKSCNVCPSDRRGCPSWLC